MPSLLWYSVISSSPCSINLQHILESTRIPLEYLKSDYRFFGKAALSMCIAYGLNWLYFDVDNTNLEAHAIRRHMFTSMVYGLVHLPFIMVLSQPWYALNRKGITLVGAALQYLVIAHDCPDTNPEDLTEEYQLNSEDHISAGLRWFFCAGLATGLLCMGTPP